MEGIINDIKRGVNNLQTLKDEIKEQAKIHGEEFKQNAEEINKMIEEKMSKYDDVDKIKSAIITQISTDKCKKDSEYEKELKKTKSKNLNDLTLLKMLAICSEDIYDQEDAPAEVTIPEYRYKLKLNEILKLDIVTKWKSGGVYEILDGEHKGERILAFKGTSCAFGLLQDYSIATNGIFIRQVIDLCTEYAVKYKVNWVCGHSLGGLIAECVCDRTGIGGASFNSPAPWSDDEKLNLAYMGKYDNVPFECHLTKSDPISYAGNTSSKCNLHIGTPIWNDKSEGHKMTNLRKYLETL